MLQLFNTMSRRREKITALSDNTIRMYTCGPTVYDYAHIGNFRSFLFSDLLVRYLQFKGFKTRHVMGITDIDDKIIKRGLDKGVDPLKLALEFEGIFKEELEELNVHSVDVFPRSTELINEIIAQVKRMLGKKAAYQTKNGVYFEVAAFPQYGKLSHQNLEELSKHRIEPDEHKKDQKDFALWKITPKDEINWDSPWGKGRPGWHIEDTAMSEKHLGEQYDLHAGGIDLVFPHHECEIAQMESLTGKPLVKYWVHPEHLMVDGRKMAKSEGNFFTLNDVLKKGYSPQAFRYLCLSSHYRSQLNFTFEGLKTAENTVSGFLGFYQNVKEYKPSKEKNAGKEKKQADKEKQGGDGITELCGNALKKFEEVLDDDLNTPQALAVVFDFVKEVNKAMQEKTLGKSGQKRVIAAIERIDEVLGLLHYAKTKSAQLSEEKIKELIEQREAAKKEKDYEKADEIREKLREKGVLLEDTKDGVKFKIA
ncbi:cysteine--tRNA ligase [Candidatus Micrarchaeota archaeon]|nr:cysteine--tRNA ligase [Candidatus Micrarchaeota archaeon]